MFALRREYNGNAEVSNCLAQISIELRNPKQKTKKVVNPKKPNNHETK